METRANHVVIGCFVLAVIAGIFGFVIWLARIDIDREVATYAITFDNAVTGLSVGGDVRFNGIRVGEVTRIKIDRDNLERVLVRVEVAADTPVREDTVASVEFQGITGVSYIQLSGGSAAKKILWPPKRDGEVPVIPSTPSAIQELFAGAPELIDRIVLLVNQGAKVVNDKNLTHFTNILENIEVVSGHVAAKGPAIEATVDNVNRMTTDLSAASAELRALVPAFKEVIEEVSATLAVTRGTLGTVDAVVETDLRPLLASINASAQNLDRLTRQVEDVVTANREAIDVFASDGLVELTKFIEEARVLVGSATRLVDEIGKDPAQFLFGRQKGGVEVR